MTTKITESLMTLPNDNHETLTRLISLEEDIEKINIVNTHNKITVATY
jgi:hypothetical protein